MASVRHRASSDREVTAATRRGREEQRAAYASKVRYSRAHDTFVLTMYSGTIVEIPRKLVPMVANVPTSAASAVILSPMGSSLHWDALDVDFSVPGLIREVFGMTAALRRAGATKSKARAKASKANGLLGGRPAKKRPKLAA